MSLWAGALVATAVAFLGAAVWGLSRAIVGLSAQLAVLTLVVHDVRDQVAALDPYQTRE